MFRYRCIKHTQDPEFGNVFKILRPNYILALALISYYATINQYRKLSQVIEQSIRFDIIIKRHSISPRLVAGQTKSIPFGASLRFECTRHTNLPPARFSSQKHSRWHCVTQFSWHRISNSRSSTMLCMSSIDSNIPGCLRLRSSLCLTQSTSYPSQPRIPLCSAQFVPGEHRKPIACTHAFDS